MKYAALIVLLQLGRVAVAAEPLPAMQAEPLAANTVAHNQLTAKLDSLELRSPAGTASLPLTAQVTGRTCHSSAGEGHVQAVAFGFRDDQTTLVVRDAAGEHRIACGCHSRLKGRADWTTRQDPRAAIEPNRSVAAGGAWTSDNAYATRLCFHETPYYLNVSLRFSGDEVVVDSEYNVAFGPTKLPQLAGHAHR
jgi:hypothetical protein